MTFKTTSPALTKLTANWNVTMTEVNRDAHLHGVAFRVEFSEHSGDLIQIL